MSGRSIEGSGLERLVDGAIHPEWVEEPLAQLLVERRSTSGLRDFSEDDEVRVRIVVTGARLAVARSD